MASPFRLKTALPDDVLRVHSCTSREGLSEAGDTTLTLLSERKDILASELLGKLATLTIALREDAPRHLSGYVTRFAQRGFEGKHCVYEMQLKPWLWLLSRTADCRIFQEMSVPDIVKQVFEDHPVARYEFKLLRPYRTWNYCVQYRETDFNFVARLLEHEGIYWYVEHDESGHKVVLCDSASGHDAKPGCESLPFYGSGAQAAPQLEYVQSWNSAECVRPGKVVITDYDFQRPSNDLETSRGQPRNYDLSDGEIFDYPGGFIVGGDGAQYAEDRLDELQTAYQSHEGSTNAQGVHAGHLLTLTRHPRDIENTEYLVTSTVLQLQQAANEAASGDTSLRCSFSCIPSSQQYRPPRRTPKPLVAGPQTAIVTGPAGEEIHTDVFGRVKVQFHWDRRGKRDERSSCWVSVAHPWAGSNFGGIHIPRIGQEVIIGFIEGDPDAPIIMGRTYNGENLPPWELPANATQSGFLTRSTKGGSYGNANAIRFEDKQGAEQLWIHAEKNQDIEVENDETHWVGQDRMKTIDRHETVRVKGNRTETVDLNEQIDIKQDRTEHVFGRETVTIDQNRVNTIGQNHQESIGKNHKTTIGKNQSINVGKHLTETVGMTNIQNVGLAKMTNVGLGYMVNVGAAYSLNTGGLMNVVVGAAYNEQIAKSRSISAGDNIKITASKTLSITGEQKITEKGKEVFIEGSTKLVLAVGASTITMTAGEININSPLVKINCPAGPAMTVAAPDSKGNVQSGLGQNVDDIAGKSPTLQKDMQELKEAGWTTQYGPNGQGSHANRDSKVITIDGNLKNDPAQATQVLAHEVGHAKYDYKPDFSSKQSYLGGAMADEGAATMKNIEVRREILANGGPDIKIAGNSANHPSYNAAYDQYLKDGNAAAARDKIGTAFGNGERVSGATNPTYNEYYGGWYDKTFPGRP